MTFQRKLKNPINLQPTDPVTSTKGITGEIFNEYEKTFNKYVKNLDQHKKEIVVSSNEKTYELKNKYSIKNKKN